MHIVYTPEDGEKREWDFKLGRLLTTEVEAIEKRASVKYGQFLIGIAAKDATSRRALVWTLLRRAEAGLQFVDVDFAMDDLQVTLSDEENADLRNTFRAVNLKGQELRAALFDVGLPFDEPESESPKDGPDAES